MDSQRLRSPQPQSPQIISSLEKPTAAEHEAPPPAAKDPLQEIDEETEPPKPETPPEPFSYERPVSMDLAEPNRWMIEARKALPGDFAESLFAMAPDGIHLAVWPTSEEKCTIKIHDLKPV